MRGFIGNGARVLIQRAAPAGADECVINALEYAFKADYAINWPSGTAPFDGITELLETLQERNYPLSVLSNKPHPFTTTMVSQVFPRIHFTSVLGQRPGIAHKPDPAGALEIAASFGLAAANCTLIGDSTMDIETAHNAGMKSIAVDWGFHDRDHLAAAKPGWIAASPTEIENAFLM